MKRWATREDYENEDTFDVQFQSCLITPHNICFRFAFLQIMVSSYLSFSINTHLIDKGGNGGGGRG